MVVPGLRWVEAAKVTPVVIDYVNNLHSLAQKHAFPIKLRIDMKQCKYKDMRCTKSRRSVTHLQANLALAPLD